MDLTQRGRTPKHLPNVPSRPLHQASVIGCEDRRGGGRVRGQPDDFVRGVEVEVEEGIRDKGARGVAKVSTHSYLSLSYTY